MENQAPHDLYLKEFSIATCSWELCNLCSTDIYSGECSEIEYASDELRSMIDGHFNCFAVVVADQDGRDDL